MNYANSDQPSEPSRYIKIETDCLSIKVLYEARRYAYPIVSVRNNLTKHISIKDGVYATCIAYILSTCLVLKSISTYLVGILSICVSILRLKPEGWLHLTLAGYNYLLVGAIVRQD